MSDFGQLPSDGVQRLPPNGGDELDHSYSAQIAASDLFLPGDTVSSQVRTHFGGIPILDTHSVWDAFQWLLNVDMGDKS